jgi:hypothetical protein
MLADPQTVTVDSTPITLNRVSSEPFRNVYRTADGADTLTVSHQFLGNGRIRTLARFDHDVLSADPFVPANNKWYSMSTYLVIDRPAQGIAGSVAEDNVQGLVDWLDQAGFIADLVEQQS